MAEEALPDVETWDEIKVTALFTSISMAAFIIVFEVCRRLPSVSFVFDKRRASKPHRTPPPLIKSRYFEWLFVSTDPAYSECADMAFQKGLIKERAARRKNKRRRRGGSGYNRGTTAGSGNEGVGNEPSKKPKTNNTNEPVYPPKKPNMSSHISSRKMKQKNLIASRTASVPVDIDAIDDDDESSSDQEKQTPTNKSNNNNGDDDNDGPIDLDADCASSSDGERGRNDPDDDDKFQMTPPPPSKGNRKTYDGSSSSSPRSEKMRQQPQQKSYKSNDTTLQSNDTTVVVSNTTATTNNNTNTNYTPSTQKRKQYTASPSSSSLVRFHDDIDKLEKGLSTTPLAPSSPSRKQHHKRTHSPYHFSIVEVDGRRLPAEIAEYAIAGDLTETQLEDYERWVCEWEDEEEHRFKERLKLNAGGVLSRWRFLGFGITSSSAKGKNGEDEERSGVGGSVSRSRRSQRNGDGGGGAVEMTTLSTTSKHRKSHSMGSTTRNGGGTTTTITNRHLSANVKVHRRPLNRADEELLRCVGLDAFVMIRFLRFGFDVTFYPFVVACLVLIPTYYTNPYLGDESQGIVTSGYFRVTMTRLQPGCWRLWITWSFAVGFYLFILRRIWIEWETFVALRFEFLANGDGEEMDVIVHQEYESERERSRQIKLQVQQFRNSCMVEFVPESHRRDKELYEFFDALFPGQVKRAEMMLNAGQLTKLIQERQRYIVKYEDLYAKYFHARANYRQKMLCDDNTNPTNNNNNTSTTCDYLCCCCCALQAKKPSEPIVKIGGYYFCCNRKMVKALPYYLSEIKRLNRQIEEEHRRILTEKERIEDKDDTRGFIASGISHGVTFVTGGFGRDLTCDTGFVEFKNLTTKQSATQCNIGGTMEYMETISAPDPRDIVWENATVPRSTIRWKVLQTDALLFTGTLFWGAVVTLVTSISKLDSLDNVLPSWLIPQNDTFMYSLIQGYLPVITLELLMIILPFIFKIVASTYIRHKTKSEIEKFVFLWHFAYRLANLLVIIISGSFTESLDALANNPELFVLNLAAGIGKQSQFFLNNVIVQAGSETMWELAQVPDMVKHFIMYKFITVDAKSRRALEKLQMAERLNFGEILPSFIFTFMVAMVYCCQVPIVIGACSVVFYFASKVYHHQALFVYANSYEGGGKLMYPLNRMIFVTLYITMCLFSIMLGLKDATIQASLFVFLVGSVTFVVDRKVLKTFVEPSLTLALTNARIIDEENKRKALRIQQYKEYKKLKRDKRKAAFKAAAHAKRMARAAVKKRQQQQKEQLNDDHSSPRSASLFPTMTTPSSISPSPLYDKNNHKKPTPLKLFRDESDTPEKQRQSKPRQRRQPYYDFDADKNYDSSDNEARTTDFYCYRQPQLNKALWETKPRPYR